MDNAEVIQIVGTFLKWFREFDGEQVWKECTDSESGSKELKDLISLLEKVSNEK